MMKMTCREFAKKKGIEIAGKLKRVPGTGRLIIFADENGNEFWISKTFNEMIYVYADGSFTHGILNEEEN